MAYPCLFKRVSDRKVKIMNIRKNSFLLVGVFVLCFLGLNVFSWYFSTSPSVTSKLKCIENSIRVEVAKNKLIGVSFFPDCIMAVEQQCKDFNVELCPLEEDGKFMSYEDYTLYVLVDDVILVINKEL